MESLACISILVVEDEKDLRESVVAVLEGEGFLVRCASTSEEAVRALHGMPQPALILADLVTATSDGRSLLSAARKSDCLAALPVVIMSTTDDNAPGGLRKIKKPIDWGDLVRMVGALCQRQG